MLIRISVVLVVKVAGGELCPGPSSLFSISSKKKGTSFNFFFLFILDQTIFTTYAVTGQVFLVTRKSDGE